MAYKTLNLSFVLWLCLWENVHAFDLEQQTELFIGIGAGIGGLILGVLLVIVALLCRKQWDYHEDKRRRKKSPYSYELMDWIESLSQNKRSRNSQHESPMSFQNDTFTIAETAFNLPRARPIGTFSTSFPDSEPSNHSLSRNSSFHSNAYYGELQDKSVARQHSSGGCHIKTPLTPNSFRQSHVTNSSQLKERAKIHSFHNNRNTREQSSVDRDATKGFFIKGMQNDGGYHAGQVHTNLMDNFSLSGYDVAGNRNSFTSLLSANEMSRFSLPRLSVRRSENYVDVTGENHAFSPLPE